MPIERRRRSRATEPVASAVAVLSAIGACTGTSTKPLGVGDDLTVDVDATPAPPDPREDASAAADSPYGFLDGPYGVLGADAYDPLGACEQCACPSGSYCAGEGIGLAAGSAACGPQADGGASGVGCVELPAGCANEPDCTCLLKSLGSGLSCSPVCAENGGFAVYCPTP